MILAQRPPFWIIGAALPQPTPAPGEEATDPFTKADLQKATRTITLTLIFGAVVAGATFAIGSGLVSRYVFKEGR